MNTPQTAEQINAPQVGSVTVAKQQRSLRGVFLSWPVPPGIFREGITTNVVNAVLWGVVALLLFRWFKRR